MSDDTEIHKKIQDVDQNTYAIAKQELEKKLEENEKVVLSAFPEICIDDFRTLETEDILLSLSMHEAFSEVANIFEKMLSSHFLGE